MASTSAQTTSRTAVRGLLLASSVYFLAVLHRASLGVAGLLAERRFGIGPAQLSLFVFLQIGVYAAMQVPTGVLVDRYGPRRVLIAAASIMGSAQLLFSLVPSFPLALLARAALGCGDALTFVSVLRFAATHFPARRYPLLIAVTGMIGTLGNIMATLPLALALRHIGWTPPFLTVGALSLVTGIGVALWLPDRAPRPAAVGTVREIKAGTAVVWRRVRASWSQPGTRVGYWTHFTAMSAGTTLGVLWGSPYLQKVSHFSAAGAGLVLMASVIASALVSPCYGWLIGRWPHVRVPVALGVSAASALGLTALSTVYGDAPPRPVVVAVFVIATTGPPVSMAAFALARDYNHARTLGTASGVVNVGGFVATVVIALGIGWALDLQGGTTPHTLRWALLVAPAVQAFGIWRTTLWWLRARSDVLDRQHRGEQVPVLVVRRRFDLRRRTPELLAPSPIGEGPPVE